MSAIGVQLGHLRVARGLTQQQLAERTGLRRDTISALERGKSQAIEFTTLASLCDALGVGPGDLLTLGPTAHVAPILGGEDEDAILIERMAQDELDIAAFRADPLLALRFFTLEDETVDESSGAVSSESDVAGPMRPIKVDLSSLTPAPTDYAEALRAVHDAAEKLRDLDVTSKLYSTRIGVADVSRVAEVATDHAVFIISAGKERATSSFEGGGIVGKSALPLSGGASAPQVVVYLVNENRLVLIPTGETIELSALVATSTWRLR